MSTYDEGVLVEYVAQLERKISQIVFQTAFKYGFVALLVAFIGSAVVGVASRQQVPVIPICVAVTAVAITAGIVEGKRLAFELRLEAQKLLALIQIEHNTRRGG
jgi:hypothetical protein